jgi:hypothetical protein
VRNLDANAACLEDSTRLIGDPPDFGALVLLRPLSPRTQESSLLEGTGMNLKPCRIR